MTNIASLVNRSLSWGTTIPKDLFHALIPVCAMLGVKLDQNFYGDLDPMANDYTDEQWWTLWNDMAEALDSHAPEGFYFGSHPDDGADVGFWEFEDDDADPTEPTREDYVIRDCGPLLSRSTADIVEGDHIGVFSCHSEAINACQIQQQRDGIYTNIWIMDDHGGWTLVKDRG